MLVLVKLVKLHVQPFCHECIFAELRIAQADVHIWVLVECAEGNRNPVHYGRKSVLALDFADGFMFLIIDFDCISLSRNHR